MVINDDDYSQLPPALRLAAISSAKKKQAYTDTTKSPMTLRDEAKKMRLRLSKLEGSCSSVATTSTTDADSKSGTHSTELLKKKLKKVEKMLDKSTVGTKEYKNLQKKRTEYQNQIGQQEEEEEQECCDVVSHSLRSLRLSQLEDSNSSVMTTPDVENASKLTTDTNKSSGTHSTEMLKKKLKKVEKMLDKSTVGTKEYKNLQKKRTEYQNQIGQQGEEEEQEFEKDNTNIKEDAREEARRLMRNALEKKKAKTDAARTSKAKRSKEEKEKALLKKKQIQQHQELAMETKRKEEEEINKREEEERERQRPFKDAEADRKKKEAFLEEAQRLKKEAMENRRIHEKQEEEERQQRQYDRKKNEADLEEAQRLKKEAMENKRIREKQEEEERQQRQCQIDDDDRKKNLADLEEAQRLKKEAMENKRIREKQEEEERQQLQCQIDDDDRKKNEADLEEARKLNEEVMEVKRIQEKQEEEELQRQCQVDDENRKKHEADLEEFRRQKKEEMEKNYIQNKIIEFAVVEENEIKRKQAILEEARALKKEAMEKKRIQDKLIKNGDDDSDRDSDTDSDSDSDDDSGSYSDKDEEEMEEEEQRQCQDDDDDDDDDDEISKEKEIEGEEHKQEAIEETMAVDIHTIEQNNREMDQQSQRQERTESETKEEKDTTQPQEASKDFLDLRTLAEPYSDNTKKILKDLESNEIRQNKIERILVQNGVAITGCIAYEEAKDKIAEITDSMKDLMVAEMDSYTKEKKYFALEEQLAKYTTALMLTDEYAEDQIRQEKNWEDSIENDNIAAIQKLRSHMPVKIRHMTEDELATSTTPNGKTLPKVFARKFKRTNILLFLRVDPDDIEKMHPSTLESTRTTGLTLTERRAIHEHFKEIVDRWAKKKSDPSMEKKWQWYQSLRTKFREILNAYSNCVDKYGPPGNHQYAKRDDPGGGGCPLLGNQCPLKADATMDYSEDYGYTKEAEYESSSGDSGSRIKSPRGISRSQQNTSAKSKSSEAEMMEEFRCRLHLDTNETDVDTKLLRELSHSHKRIKTLEKQLAFAGLSLPEEDISYSAAKARVSGLTEELQTLAAAMGNTNEKELAEQESEFGRLSQELDKYNNALMLTKEWAQEQKDRERQWEINVSQANYVALQKIRRHMPVDIRNMSETALSSYSTPNGKVLPMAIVKKFKRTNILMILRTDPADIELMHPSSIEAMRTTGLTLTERRALHEHLKETAPKWKAMKSDKSCERKWMWHASLQSKLKEMMEKYDKHVETYGPPENHPYKKRNDPPDGTGCPLLGNQCPVKADLTINYNDDYGFPDHAEYEKQSVAKSNLLTMDDIDKRKREEDAYYSGSSGHS